jgi:oxygen-dependent protoporphyrinogen oxidase
MIDVVIVGGGISGLSAARALCARGLDVRLIEREPACGGVIHTDHVDGFVIDSGPDTLLAHKPAALDLVQELGLGGELIAPIPRRTTYVVRQQTLRSLPETSAFGLPVGWRTVADARAFSWPGKLRMALEPFVPASPQVEDESVGVFVRRRFGREAEEYVAEPVLAGLHRGDASSLSLHALFPFLAHAERTHGSVARAWQHMPKGPGRASSMSLRNGLAEIPRRMQQVLRPGVSLTGTEVVELERGQHFTLQLAAGEPLRARAVLLATPAYVTSRLVAGIDDELARLCAGIRYVPALTVALGYVRDAIAAHLDGWGFVVPARERRRVRSASWVSSKWPGRAPGGHALLRLSLQCAAADLEAADETVAGLAHDDVRSLLNITAEPVMARVYRRPLAMPQLEVGHLQRIAAIDKRLSNTRGLFISAAGFRGVGLPDCIADARAVSEKIFAALRDD